MITSEDTIAHIARQVGCLYYHHPLMYGGSGAGVDLLLHTYHDIWAVIVGRRDEFRKTWWKVLEEEDCGSADFSTRYSMNHPEASDKQIAAYVVSQWRKVSERLGVPIPHAELIAEFRPDDSLGQ
jgi:hypothetical protein